MANTEIATILFKSLTIRWASMLLIATFFIMTVIRPIDTANTVLQWLGISFVFGASLLIPWIYSLFVNPSTGAKSKNVEQDVAIVSGERKKVSDTNGT